MGAGLPLVAPGRGVVQFRAGVAGGEREAMKTDTTYNAWARASWADPVAAATHLLAAYEYIFAAACGLLEWDETP